MKRDKQIFIGGEKVFPFPLYFSKKRRTFISENEKQFTGYYLNYTFGGYYSLLAIIDHLRNKHNCFKVLLPSYLCDSVLIPFKQKKIAISFYRVNSNLEPDFIDIKTRITVDVKAILFIDYMGKSLKSSIEKNLDFFEVNGIEVIQDFVQNIDIKKEQLYGDYAFNSFRKFYSFEGSIIISKKPFDILFEKSTNYRFIINKRIGQILRYFYLNLNVFSPKIFLYFFNKAEENYYSNKIYRLSAESKMLLNRVDNQKLINKHRVYYQNLLLVFGSFVPTGLNIKEFTPLGFFIQTNNRNEVRIQLKKNNIFCPIHWAKPLDVSKEEFPESDLLSERALTIPLSDLNDNSLEYLKYNLNKYLIP